MGAGEVEQFLTHLAVNGKVSASTQNQAKAALLFLYKEVLAVELPWLDKVEQAKAPKRLPVVLNRDEVQAILSRLDGTTHLIASLLYGTGMRIMECLRLRVQDVDFKRREILIRDGKAYKCRFLKKFGETVPCGKLMGVNNIILPEVSPCLAILDFTNGSTRLSRAFRRPASLKLPAWPCGASA